MYVLYVVLSHGRMAIIKNQFGPLIIRIIQKAKPFLRYSGYTLLTQVESWSANGTNAITEKTKCHLWGSNLWVPELGLKRILDYSANIRIWEHSNTI